LVTPSYVVKCSRLRKIPALSIGKRLLANLAMIMKGKLKTTLSIIKLWPLSLLSLSLINLATECYTRDIHWHCMSCIHLKLCVSVWQICRPTSLSFIS